MSTVGSLVVDLSANVAKFQSDMGKAAAIAEERLSQIDKMTGIVKGSLVALGAGFAASMTFDALKSKIEGAIESAAGLQQLSERTGATVEALSGLVSVAKLSDTGMEELATGLQKLSKSVIDAENGGKKAVGTFDAIGLSVEDIKDKKPEDIFKSIADKLALYEDGVEKTTVMQNLFGKSGANLIPVMNDLALIQEYQVKVTKEQAEAADELDKNQKRLHASTDAIYKIIGLELVPVLNELTAGMLEAQRANDGIKQSVSDLAADGSIREWAENAAVAFGYVIEAVQGLIKFVSAAIGSFQAVYADIEILFVAAKNRFGVFSAEENIALQQALQERNEIAEKANKRYEDLWNYNSNAVHEGIRNRFNDAKNLRDFGIETEPPRKKLSGSGLGNSNVGPKDDPTRKALEGALKEQEDFVAREKALLQTREQYLDYYANLEYTTKREAEESKQQLIAESLASTQAAYDKEIAALQYYIEHSTEDVTGQKTNRQDAINKQEELLRKKVAAEIEANKKIGDSQLAVMGVQRQFELATKENARTQDIANQTMEFQNLLLGKSTLEVQKATAARQIDLDVQQRIYELRKKDKDFDVSKALADAEEQKVKRLQLIQKTYEDQRSVIYGTNEALRKYAEHATNSAAQIENMLTNAFKGAEDAFVEFVKTGKLSFSGLATSIINDLIRIQVQQSVTAPLAAMMKNSGGLTGSLKSLFGGFFADGGDPPVGIPSVVGENGPELFVPKSAGTIVPNNIMNSLGSNAGDVIVQQPITINAPNATPGTVQQIQAMMPMLLSQNKDSIVAAVKMAMRSSGGRLQV
jgi:lambda family phage tail tape measure protein